MKEKKKMAIINLTCDFPNEYCAAELGKWAGVSASTALNLCNQLSLDAIKGNSRRGNRTKRIITGHNEYFKKEYENRNKQW